MLAQAIDAGLCPVQTVPNSWEYGALCMRLITCCQFRVVIHMPFKCPWLSSTWLQRFLIARRGCCSSSPGSWAGLGVAPNAARGAARSKRALLRTRTLLARRCNSRIAARIVLFILMGSTSHRLMAWNPVRESKGMLESTGWIPGRDLISFVCFIDTVACDATLACDKSRG